MSRHTASEFKLPCNCTWSAGCGPNLLCPVHGSSHHLAATLAETRKKLADKEARIKELDAENQRPRDAHWAVGAVREHNGSLMVIGALHPQIELDALPIGTKVYIRLALL